MRGEKSKTVQGYLLDGGITPVNYPGVAVDLTPMAKVRDLKTGRIAYYDIDEYRNQPGATGGGIVTSLARRFVNEGAGTN